MVAAAFMVGLIDEAAELLDVQGASDNQVPEEEEEDVNVSYHTAPHQLAAIRVRIHSLLSSFTFSLESVPHLR